MSGWGGGASGSEGVSRDALERGDPPLQGLQPSVRLLSSSFCPSPPPAHYGEEPSTWDVLVHGGLIWRTPPPRPNHPPPKPKRFPCGVKMKI